MKHVPSSLSVVAILCCGAASTHIAAAQSIAASSSSSASAPVAYVYVSGVYDIGDYKINAFAAAADGSLTPIPGEPFAGPVTSMAVNGKYLFGADTDQIHIDSFVMGKNGALYKVASTEDPRHQGGNCDAIGPLFLDHSGDTLYSLESGNPYCSNNTYQSFKVNWQTGRMNYLDHSGNSPYLNVPLSFIENNEWAYGADCELFGNPANNRGFIYGFMRESDGFLVAKKISAPLPPLSYTKGFYCPVLTAADPYNDVAVVMEGIPDVGVYGPFQIATYRADNSGNLKLTSNANMAYVDVGAVLDMKMSPSGKLLAVGGVNGLQLFHVEAGGIVIAYSGQLDTGQEIQQMFWDNADHLYAISTNFQQMLVYTITPTSLTEAPGSPYSIPVPVNLIVQPKTAPPKP
ncbi:MAG: hypothetical protein ACYCOR_15860 [Acidobacteriaceae bacterium]